MGQYSTHCPQAQKDDGGSEMSLEFHWICVGVITTKNKAT